MNLSDYIELDKKDIISIVGAGGKTTMMFKLANELRLSSKILVTTTTKIYLPPKDSYDFICTDGEMIDKYKAMKENGIYVLGSGVNEEDKVLGVSEKQLEELAPYFDYILIEADGSKKKQLKGWNEFEPVVYCKTTKTVGIVDIQSLGMLVNEDKVHRSKIFCEITGARQGDVVKIEHLTKLIMHPQGLFKSAQGEKILYINKAEEAEQLVLAKSLASKINLSNNKIVHRVVIGSLKTNTYF
ncbi:putative selenium-dependent hydroxylase accessory protein YqeC [Clostridium sp. CS001]|uniref:selenium cofactor biosynthesis protein YqeC n=1 Tax=Clostridium sp. CS001 TaxID=2880648 RepID=UPI001CF52390|nr:selenium cofactor biosynthesis protein YqeC [Clostridium sp. CS001]MCB2289945.1 putative selenium-dependent hydroxylase accessory protein YqeC [Clostridium sp. CS001]